jgi:hypothetical protein
MAAASDCNAAPVFFLFGIVDFHMKPTLILSCLAPFLLPLLEARDLTFIVTSDSHYITDDNSERNQAIRRSIAEMNAITERTWPEALQGGAIAEPVAVMINGDIIDDGDKRDETALQWAAYLRDFGLTGTEGLLKYRVFDGYGNHDGPPIGAEKHGFSMQAQLKERNLKRKELGWLAGLCPKGIHYSFDLDDIHFVQVNIYPADVQNGKIRYNPVWHDPQGALYFMKSSLEEHVGNSGRPVVILSHCGFDTDWWHPEDWAEFYQVVEPYRMIGYFCGHTGTGIRKYRPEGSTGPELPVVNTGQTAVGFFVVRVTDDRIIAAYRMYQRGEWQWKHVLDRPLNSSIQTK